MAELNLNNDAIQVEDVKDSIVIVKALADIPSGAIVDINGYDQPVIKAGHIVVQTEEGEYKLLGVSGSAYTEAGADKPVGVVRASTLASKPHVAIVTQGQVNGAASPYPITKAIADALPRIEFLYVQPK